MPKIAMIVCVLVVREDGGGPNDLQYHVGIVPKDSLPIREQPTYVQLTEVRNLFSNCLGLSKAGDYRRAKPIINRARGDGNKRLGEVWYNCREYHLDGSIAPTIEADADCSQSIKDKEKGMENIRPSKNRRQRNQAPLSARMD